MMKAVSYETTTGIDALRIVEGPSPVAGPGEVLVAVESATINPVDLLAVTGGAAARMPGGAPWTPGWDLAGMVAAVGRNVNPSLVGSRVLGFSQWFQTGNGTQASEVVLPFDNVAIASAVLNSAQLTTFGLNGLTALHAVRAANVPKGGTVIVAGASGAVGSFVAELATEQGLTVIPVGRTSDRAQIAALHADAVINTGPLDQAVLDGVKDGGTAISVTMPFDAVRGITSVRVGVKPDKAGLETVLSLAQAGVLRARVGRTFPVEQAIEAYRYFAADKSHDRVVLTF